MPIIIDASIAASWILPDEHSPIAEQVLRDLPQEGGVVPDLFLHEIRNILVTNERRGRIQPTDSAQFLLRLRNLQLYQDDMQDDQTVMALARKHGLTAYDAAYLETALRRGDTLATFDHSLAEAANREHIAVIVKDG